MTAVGDADEDTGVDECAQPIRQDGAGDVEVCEEIAEAADAVEAVAQHEHRPPLAYYFERASEVAVLLRVPGSQCHFPMLAQLGLVTRPK